MLPPLCYFYLFHYICLIQYLSLRISDSYISYTEARMQHQSVYCYSRHVSHCSILCPGYVIPARRENGRSVMYNSLNADGVCDDQSNSNLLCNFKISFGEKKNIYIYIYINKSITYFIFYLFLLQLLHY